MFNKEGFEKIGEDIYVYHNFVTDEQCDEVVRLADKLHPANWEGRPDPKDHKHAAINTNIITSLQERVKVLLDNGIDLHRNNSVVRMTKGCVWGLHADNHDFLDLRMRSESLKDGEEYTLEKNNIMGLIFYFNDFEGGSLSYPEQGISYHPKRGDFVIHSSEDHCKHSVDELLSDVRYSHSNNLFNYIKVPKR